MQPSDRDSIELCLRSTGRRYDDLNKSGRQVIHEG